MPTPKSITFFQAMQEFEHGQLLVTHDERLSTPGLADPPHTCHGIERIKVLPVPEWVSMIYCGTGRRHQEMADIFVPSLRASMGENILPKYSPLVGTGDALNSDGTITLVSGKVIPYSGYHGIIEAASLGGNIRESLPRNPRLLYLAGSELFLAMGGSKDIKKYGRMYFLPLESNEVLLIEG